MFRKFAMLAAACMVCLPVGGGISPAPAGYGSHEAVSNGIADNWFLAPAEIILLCLVMLLGSHLDHCYRHPDAGDPSTWCHPSFASTGRAAGLGRG